MEGDSRESKMLSKLRNKHKKTKEGKFECNICNEDLEMSEKCTSRHGCYIKNPTCKKCYESVKKSSIGIKIKDGN